MSNCPGCGTRVGLLDIFEHRCLSKNVELGLKEDIRRVLGIYEELLYERHGKRVKAIHTRKMFIRRGFIGSLSRMMNGGIQPGFIALRDAGQIENTFEGVILKHHDSFSKETVDKAVDRIDFGKKP